MGLMSHVLDHMLNHMLDHILNLMIISLLNTALHYYRSSKLKPPYLKVQQG